MTEQENTMMETTAVMDVECVGEEESAASLKARLSAQNAEMQRLRGEVQRLRGEVSRLSERLKVSNEKVVELWRSSGSGGGGRKRSMRTSRRSNVSMTGSALKEALRQG